MTFHLCLATGICSALVPSLVAAEERQVEGVVKAVDADKFTIIVTTKTGGVELAETLDVLKKAKVTVNGQVAALKDVRRGQRVLALYDTSLEVVTKLAATGEGAVAAEPELTVLNELPEGASHSAPWVSPDGLTLYWKSLVDGEKQVWIWSARRKGKEALFEGFQRLVPGYDPTVSADGLEMILDVEQSLCVTTRASKDAAFARPRKIAEFQGLGFIASPCLSQDGLTLHADRIVPNRPVEFVRFTRPNRRSKWSGPTTLTFTGLGEAPLRFVDVSSDGLRAFCTSLENFQVPTTNNLFVFQADAKRTGFTSPKNIRVAGQTIRGKFPRYVAATNELFFAGPRAGAQGDRLLLIRNFDPDALTSAD